MRGVVVLLVTAVVVWGSALGYRAFVEWSRTGAPPYAEADLEPPAENSNPWSDWKRPDGPARVGLQVGHWKNNQVPEELERLKGNTGASGGGKWEWEVNMEIASKTKDRLEESGIVVDILPATIPPGYWADVFLAIHADGSLDGGKSGYKFAKPRRDYSGKGERLLELLYKTYGDATGMEIDPNVTRNMRGYYAFAWWRYNHAVHPMTTSAIAETGFLTSKSDQRILIGNPGVAAQGLADGVIQFLKEHKLI